MQLLAGPDLSSITVFEKNKHGALILKKLYSFTVNLSEYPQKGYQIVC